MAALRRISFRANEAASSLRESAVYEYSRWLKDSNERAQAIAHMENLIERYGPVVEGYPCWHPFTSGPQDDNSRYRDPQYEPVGFEGLDHTIYLRDAFITAPYGDADRVIKSALKKESEYIDAEEIQDVPLYSNGVTPVLVTCAGIPKERDGTIAKRFALGSMLTEELPGWTSTTCGESWDDMRRHILGIPCGSRSSLFVNQDTGKALREVFELLNRHELFGPLRR